MDYQVLIHNHLCAGAPAPQCIAMYWAMHPSAKLINIKPCFIFQLGSLSHKFDLLEQDRNRLSDLALELETTKNNLEECLQNLDREKGEWSPTG